MELKKLDGELEILVDYSDDPVITLRGEVDFRNMAKVKQAVYGLVERGQASISVDLKELVFMDSTGVSALIDAAKAIVPRGGSIRLISPSPQLAKFLEQTGLADILHYDSIALHREDRPCPVTRPAPVVEFEIPSRAEMLSHIRAKVEEMACMMPFSREDIEDIKLAVGEAGANALKHGTNPDWPRVTVRIERTTSALKVSISDRGRGFDPDSIRPPEFGSLSESGRGIAFMKALMDEVRFFSLEPGTRVELTKHLGHGHVS